MHYTVTKAIVTRVQSSAATAPSTPPTSGQLEGIAIEQRWIWEAASSPHCQDCNLEVITFRDIAGLVRCLNSWLRHLPTTRPANSLRDSFARLTNTCCPFLIVCCYLSADLGKVVLSFNSKRELKVSDMEGLVVVWGTVILFIYLW